MSKINIDFENNVAKVFFVVYIPGMVYGIIIFFATMLSCLDLTPEVSKVFYVIAVVWGIIATILGLFLGVVGFFVNKRGS